MVGYCSEKGRKPGATKGNKERKDKKGKSRKVGFRVGPNAVDFLFLYVAMLSKA